MRKAGNTNVIQKYLLLRETSQILSNKKVKSILLANYKSKTLTNIYSIFYFNVLHCIKVFAKPNSIIDL